MSDGSLLYMINATLVMVAAIFFFKGESAKAAGFLCIAHLVAMFMFSVFIDQFMTEYVETLKKMGLGHLME